MHPVCAGAIFRKKIEKTHLTGTQEGPSHGGANPLIGPRFGPWDPVVVVARGVLGPKMPKKTDFGVVLDKKNLLLTTNRAALCAPPTPPQPTTLKWAEKGVKIGLNSGKGGGGSLG